MEQLFHQFLEGLRATTLPEYIAVITGIAGVLYSRSASVWLYPLGIISTVIYVYISFAGKLYAEAGLNIYYVVMNVTGWYMWTRRGKSGEKILQITVSGKRDWQVALFFFTSVWIALYLLLLHLTDSSVPLEDALASAAAYTGMLLMNKKKVENWFWWIVTNVVSIPLYYIKGYVFTSVQFVILLIIAVSGWMTWYRKWQQENALI